MNLFYDLKEEARSAQSNLVTTPLPIQTEERSNGFIYVPKDVEMRSAMLESETFYNLSEQFKGLVEKEKTFTYEDVGEPLPYKMNVDFLQGIYSNVGFVTGVIDKYVDFIISPGFYVKSDDLRAQTLIEQFIKEHNFDMVLRNWIKDGLICGNGYMELAGNGTESIKKIKVLNPKYMFVKRDDYGKVTGYTQYFGMKGQQKQDKVYFDEKDVAHFAFNRVGDFAYGIGIIYPALTLIDNILKASKDMHKILSRKANTQIHVQMGDPATGRVPTPEVISSFGQKMYYMNEKTEWVTDCFVNMKVLDFGNVSDKFVGVMDIDFDFMFFTFQVPEVLMGGGNIPEGLAKVQMDGFQRRIQSIQAELQRIIETRIFKRILNAQGIDAHVELFWGQQSDDDRRQEIDRLLTLLQNPLISSQLRANSENRLSLLLGFTEKVETDEQEKKRELEKEKIPVVPGQNKTQPKGFERVFKGELIECQN